MSAKGKKVLIVIAHNNFRDEEYTACRKAIEDNGGKVVVASTVTENALGSQGLVVNPDLFIDDVSADDFDGVVFIGGTGASQFWHDVVAHDIAKTLLANDKVVAASSHSPVTLAVAGVLRGKKATGHVTIYEKLQVAGAEYTAKKLEQDGKIITACGVNAAKEFALAINATL